MKKVDVGLVTTTKEWQEMRQYNNRTPDLLLKKLKEMNQSVPEEFRATLEQTVHLSRVYSELLDLRYMKCTGIPRPNDIQRAIHVVEYLLVAYISEMVTLLRKIEVKE